MTHLSSSRKYVTQYKYWLSWENIKNLNTPPVTCQQKEEKNTSCNYLLQQSRAYAVTANSHFRVHPVAQREAVSVTLSPPLSSALSTNTPNFLRKLLAPSSLGCSSTVLVENPSPMAVLLILIRNPTFPSSSLLSCEYRHQLRTWYVLIQYYAISNCWPFPSSNTNVILLNPWLQKPFLSSCTINASI